MDGPYFDKDTFSIQLKCSNCGGVEVYPEKDILYQPDDLRHKNIQKFNYFCKHCKNLSWNINSDIPKIVSDRIKKNPESIVLLCEKCKKIYYLSNTISSSRGKKCWTKFCRIGHQDSRIYRCICGKENFIFVWYMPDELKRSLKQGYGKV